MRKKIFYQSITLSILLALPAFAGEKGNLVIIGGGNRPTYVMQKIVDLAGGKKAKIVIIPNASSIELEVATGQKKEFEKLKPASVDYIIFNNKTADSAKNIKLIDSATGIFFSGGAQDKLFASLKGTKLFDKIKAIYYEKGGVISGTSAGAAVMSKIMLTGTELHPEDKKEDFVSIKKANVQTTQGFGFIDKAIVDQHFIKRKRENRLLSVSLEHTDLPCIGIDEATSIIVKPDDTFDVLGESTVMIFNSEKANNIKTDKKNHLSGSNINLSILQSGQSYNLKSKEVIN